MKVTETHCLKIVLTPEERKILADAADIVGEIYEEMGSACIFEISANQTYWDHSDLEDAVDIFRDCADADELKAEG